MLDHRDLCVLYHSGELAEAERSAFEAHRSSCPACRELLDALALGSRAARAGRLELPARARVRAVGRARTGARAPWGVAVAVALVLALLAQSPRGRGAIPSWHDMDRDVARLSLELDGLTADIARSESDLEIDAALRGLEREARRLSAVQ